MKKPYPQPPSVKFEFTVVSDKEHESIDGLIPAMRWLQDQLRTILHDDTIKVHGRAVTK